ncbi:pseudouridine synthase [Brachyspira pilosicoli]|uniref:Pseudouridine synthase n=1 Tax=Brachyspira pilosicoli P43/6/78 TaxID=1042417 RepID=A0A3B6VME1_BRAPL|nr:pseudouridine synthase [Brachyspira pilosicoli]AGA67043.1 ribosomal large subunit pseudouridine synthase B [Brachyspira pilosicoli P43/6/78]MBW5391367.1 rRNA pseudouridine synthase [Brachyspira pilosicoli]MBW5398648.1 rRNA pseudouridine synthase [Brachyspira pilosicoli]PLV55183.1 pseudouridine synthase [Brachyspira pilosicoli SP16]WIH87542.1 rRNA pseudouridine synthase [Brachyspira pilosicoli]
MDNKTNKENVRLVKVILESGFASRRNCEKAIMSGRVRVNNQVILDPAYRVKESDSVSIDRNIIERQTKRYMALYKPLGVVSTTKYLPGRRIITEFFKGIKERLFYAGRLDSESRGIMIITNDGEFANIITHPSYEILKVYDVTVNGKIDSEALLKASAGITIKNVTYSPFKFKILSKGRVQSKIRLTINEGKNREIRKIFDYLGYKVIDLERISVGCVSKYDDISGTLEAGHIRDLTKKEIEFFFKQKDKKLKEIESLFSNNTIIDEEFNEEEFLKENEDKKEEKKQHDKSKWAKAKPKKKRLSPKKSTINKKMTAKKSSASVKEKKLKQVKKSVKKSLKKNSKSLSKRSK